MLKERKTALSFGSVADHYERGRPGYPPEAIQWIVPLERANLIDLAAGTGKLTRQLQILGHRTVAIEPSAPMIYRLVEWVPHSWAVRAAAEAIPIVDDWADAVTVAQAFHWFDLARATPEIHRVLRPGGRLGLLWNLRDESVDWVRELSRIVGTRDAQVSSTADSERLGNVSSHSAVTTSALFEAIEHEMFEHAQQLDRNRLISLVMSRSNVATLPSRKRLRVMESVEELCTDHPDLSGQQIFSLPYKTHAFRTLATK